MSGARRLQPEDLRGVARLGVGAAEKITELVEALHAAIARVPGTAAPSPADRTRGITGLVYAGVRGAMRLTGLGLDAALRRLAPRRIGELPSSEARGAAIAALNGVLGDHLAASRNPLAIRMRLRRNGRALALHRDSLIEAFPDADGHVVVLAHGLCMSDRQWLRNGRIDDRPASDTDEEPPSVPRRSLALAATLGRRDGDLKDRLLGDGLVPLASALGRQTRTARALSPHAERSVQYETSHLALLDRPDVYRLIRDWLAAGRPAAVESRRSAA